MRILQRLTVRKDDSCKPVVKTNPAFEKRERIIRRAALEFKDGMYGILLIFLLLKLNANIVKSEKG